MKKIILLGTLIISSLSFSRDYSHNERRDVVEPTIKKEHEKKEQGVQHYTQEEMEEKEDFYDQVIWDDYD